MLTFLLQCLDCKRQAGKVKATGKYNFAYMRTQDCIQLKIKRVKKRPTGFAAETETASSRGVPPAGEATGGLFPWASDVLPGIRNTGEVEPGQTVSTSTVVPGRTGMARIYLIFLRPPRAPDSVTRTLHLKKNIIVGVYWRCGAW
eukprot:3292667-Amphidinium_carterae.7